MNALRYDPRVLDASDAPQGYVAVPKDVVQPPSNNSYPNICRECDWRSECNARQFSCMSYARKDKIGVVFKRRAI